MTMSEAQWIAMGSCGVFLIIGLLIFAVTGFWQAILVLSIFGPAVTLWLASNQLLRVKRGRPDGYYTQAIHLWVVRTGLAQSKFINHDGYWELGRSIEMSFTSKFDMSSTADDAAKSEEVAEVPADAPLLKPLSNLTNVPSAVSPRQAPAKAPSFHEQQPRPHMVNA
jgi:conjugative transfer region protein (TIGR03750 family)